MRRARRAAGHAPALHLLHNDAVVVHEPGGNVVVRLPPDAGAVGSFGGLAGLVGLLGAPAGAAIGLGAGTLIAAAFDLMKAGLDRAFIEDVATHLAPGTAAVIAAIDEYSQAPLETRMQALGGNVVRGGRRRR